MATVDRKLLRQALQQGQQTTQGAIAGTGFDPRGGVAVAALQIATAGIGAFAQNRAKKQLVNRQSFSSLNLLLIDRLGIHILETSHYA